MLPLIALLIVSSARADDGNAYAAKIHSLEAEIAALGAEAQFAVTPARVDAEILPGFLPLDEYFSLASDETSWQNRYPADYAQNLNARLGEARAELAELRSR